MTEMEYIDRLLDKLDNLNLQLLQVKRSNSSLQRQLRQARRKVKQLEETATQDKKPSLRKGQKRGAYGRHG